MALFQSGLKFQVYLWKGIFLKARNVWMCPHSSAEGRAGSEGNGVSLYGWKHIPSMEGRVLWHSRSCCFVLAEDELLGPFHAMHERGQRSGEAVLH